MTKEDYKKLVDAADIVCLNCTAMMYNSDGQKSKK